MSSLRAIRCAMGEARSPEYQDAQLPFEWALPEVALYPGERPGPRNCDHRPLSAEEYLVVLKRFRDKIAEGYERTSMDSDTPGDKFTHCSWGMCSMEPGDWPDIDEWSLRARYQPPTEKFIDGNTVTGKSASVRRRPSDLRCPIQSHVDANRGCFYQCRVFQRKRGTPPPSREQVLAWYDELIAEVELSLKWVAP